MQICCQKILDIFLKLNALSITRSVKTSKVYWKKVSTTYKEGDIKLLLYCCLQSKDRHLIASQILKATWNEFSLSS